MYDEILPEDGGWNAAASAMGGKRTGFRNPPRSKESESRIAEWRLNSGEEISERSDVTGSHRTFNPVSSARVEKNYFLEKGTTSSGNGSKKIIF